jgi:MFS transporter, ACS family, tartrate transporter
MNERDHLVARVMRRTLPLMMLIAIMNYLDRVNIAFAALQMNQDLKFSPAVYGLGAGMFFIGYVIFEVPSNLMVMRVGVRIWLARITISWGLIAMTQAWIQSETSFYVWRFLLGVAEAGLFPCVMYYFRQWFPRQERAKALAIFMSFTAIANVIGGPLAAGLMTAFDGALGLRGWQMMLLIEGAPSIILGIFAYFYITERPQDATWLAASDKQRLQQMLDEELHDPAPRIVTTLRQGFLDPRVALVTALCFFLVLSNFGIVFWLPQIIRGFGDLSTGNIGWLTALPYALACVAMIWWGRHSDRTGDRKWHLVIGALVGAAGLTFAGAFTVPSYTYVGLCVAAVGIWSMFGVFWAVPADFLSGRGAIAGLAVVSSLGSLGGFAGPYLVGVTRQMSGGFSLSLYVLAASAVVCAALAMLLKEAAVKLPTAGSTEALTRPTAGPQQAR